MWYLCLVCLHLFIYLDSYPTHPQVGLRAGYNILPKQLKHYSSSWLEYDYVADGEQAEREVFPTSSNL